MNIVFMCLPVAALIITVAVAIHAVKKGAKKRTAVIAQIIAFAAVCLISFSVPVGVSAASTGAAAGAAAGTTTSQAAAAAAASSDKGLSMLAIALASGIASIGGAIAVAAAAPAAIGATGENPEVFGKALIFVALGEGIAIYGLLIAILMLNKVQ